MIIKSDRYGKWSIDTSMNRYPTSLNSGISTHAINRDQSLNNPLPLLMTGFKRNIVAKRENTVKGKIQNPENELNYFVYGTQETLVTCLKSNVHKIAI